MNATAQRTNGSEARNGAKGQGQTKRPFKTLRRGTLKAVVWENETKTGSMFSVQLIRSYKDDKDDWQETHSLSRSDLLDAAKLLDQADTLIQQEEEQRRDNERQSQQS